LGLELFVKLPQLASVHGGHSRGREPPTPNRDLTGFAAPSSAPLSCWLTFEIYGLQITASVGRWRLSPEVRSLCLR